MPKFHLRYLVAAALLHAVALATPGPLVIVGGGGLPDGLPARMLTLAGSKDCSVVIVPFASALTDAGASSVKAFGEAGATRITVLAKDTADAAAVIRGAGLIWFPGGSQSRLMQELAAMRLVESVHAAHRGGVVIGGTSAGAAVMSEVITTGAPPRGETVPPLARGLSLWPEAIVDQHFSERKREPRLAAAIGRNPHLAGVGIDEATAVILHPGKAEVTGRGQVIVLQGAGAGAMARQVYREGESFALRPPPAAAETTR